MNAKKMLPKGSTQFNSQNDYNNTHPELSAKKAIETLFGPVDFVPILDGKIHREHLPGDSHGSRNLWYIGNSDGMPSITFGSWKTGERSTWSARKPVSFLEGEMLRLRTVSAMQTQAAHRERIQGAGTMAARRRWATASPADSDHEYLLRKRVKPFGLRQEGNLLLIPMVRDRMIYTLQTIAPTGIKRFQKDAPKFGCYSPIGIIRTGEPIYICEGWATGATLHQEQGVTVACAMDCGNLMPVARAIRSHHPAAEIVIAGDDDKTNPDNPGRKHAEAAAAALRCKVEFPKFPDDAPISLSDFNDLYIWRADHD